MNSNLFLGLKYKIIDFVIKCSLKLLLDFWYLIQMRRRRRGDRSLLYHSLQSDALQVCSHSWLLSQSLSHRSILELTEKTHKWGKSRYRLMVCSNDTKNSTKNKTIGKNHRKKPLNDSFCARNAYNSMLFLIR